MSRVTAKYQITIPPEIRKTMGIFPGMEVSFIRKGDAFELTVDPVKTLKKKWRGKFKGGVTSDQYLDDLRGCL